MNSKKSPRFVQEIRSYFIFPRSQRRALILIIFFLMGLVGWKGFFSDPQKVKETKTPFVVVEVLEGLQAKKENQGQRAVYSNSSYTPQKNNYPRSNASSIQEANLFAFDPNTVGAEELSSLGMRESSVKMIMNYRSKGGRFKKPEDLRKLYGLRQEEADLLISWVRIEQEEEPMMAFSKNNPSADPEINAPKPAYKKEPKTIAMVDINLTDVFSLQTLPGIGEKRAAAIIKYREQLGGFLTKEQVGEVYIIPDSVFQKIAPYLQFQPEMVKKMALNTIPEEDLKMHPYIGWQMAKAIVAYRKQHGTFQSADELLKIHIIKKEWLERVKPYLQIDP